MAKYGNNLRDQPKLYLTKALITFSNVYRTFIKCHPNGCNPKRYKYKDKHTLSSTTPCSSYLCLLNRIAAPFCGAVKAKDLAGGIISGQF